ncbi:hydroxyethylthiazole kinase [candidate division KSB1 bacterium]
MNLDNLKSQIGNDLKLIREKKPLVHSITNYVVMNSTANALLSIGASPIMAHAQEEVEELVSFSAALVLNIGTLENYWIESMLIAGKMANSINIPVILDPVGSGATKLRTESSKRILNNIDVAVIRGNASEVLSLAKEGSKTKGVDSIHSVDDAAEAGKILAKEWNTVIAITGAVDMVTDGETVYRISNGHPLMGMVTGTGCTATVIAASFAAVNNNYLEAAAGGLVMFGLAGEKASEDTNLPGTYGIKLIDHLNSITVEELVKNAKIE